MGGDARTPPTPTGGRKLEIKIMELKNGTYGGVIGQKPAGRNKLYFLFIFYSGWDATAYKNSGRNCRRQPIGDRGGSPPHGRGCPNGARIQATQSDIGAELGASPGQDSETEAFN
jgi:hypothetical protein